MKKKMEVSLKISYPNRTVLEIINKQRNPRAVVYTIVYPRDEAEADAWLHSASTAHPLV
jgi:hypothetical protein